ncbi:hypothetical protein V6N13_033987 [Hibiscus sabdariffa]
MENSLPSPRISRKHRRLDNDPLDDGGPLSGSPEAVHQKPIPSIPSYMDSLMKNSSNLPSEIDECIDDDDDDDIEFEEGEVIWLPSGELSISDPDLHHEEPMEAPVIPEQVKPASPFGPWMVVERRQRRITKQPTANPGKSNGVVFRASRFNHIHDLDQVEPSGKRVESFLQPQPQSVVQTALSKAKLKSKISHSTSRLASKTTPTVNLDTSKHSTVVMDENSNPNVHHFFRPLDDPANGNFKHIAGDSSTRPLGDPPDNSINSVVQPEGPDTLGKIRNNSGTNPKEGLSHALGSEQSMAMLE